ncbi:MAG: hypothetical protein WDM90_14870 [Ferruginibacter sp.]
MKRIFFASLLLITVTAATAQREDKEEKTGALKKKTFLPVEILQHLFTAEELCWALALLLDTVLINLLTQA